MDFSEARKFSVGGGFTYGGLKKDRHRVDLRVFVSNLSSNWICLTFD